MPTRRTTFALLLLLFALPVCAQTPDAKQALNEKLWEAARGGDAAAVKSLLEQGADVNAKFRYGQTPLFKAAERGHTEVIKLLLERGADANAKDTFYGATPITWAADKGHVEAVRALLGKGAQGVEDVLMTGVFRGNAEMVGVALGQGGVGAERLTVALFTAASDEKKTAIADMLRKAGAAPPLQVESATLQSYAGSYKSEAGAVVEVSVREGRLFYTAAGRQPLPLIAPADKTVFRPTFDGFYLTFNVEGGKASSLNVKQGPNTTVYKRVEQ